MPAAPPPLEYRWQTEARAAIASMRDAKGRARAQAQLERTVASVTPATRVPNARALREAAAHELARRGRYQLLPVRPPEKSWLRRLWEWTVAQYHRLFDPLFERVHVGRTGEIVFGDALIFLFVLIVGFVGARLLGSVAFVRDGEGAAVAALEARRNAQALFVEAAESAARGDFASAIRTLFLAAVTLLELRGALRDDAAATVNQLRAELAARHARADAPFGSLASAFTAVAYAERPVTGEDWDRARAAYERLSEAVLPA